MNQPLLEPGSYVRRRHPWDGSSRAGMPIGPWLLITKVYRAEPFAVYQLTDGRNEFECNLYPASPVDDRREFETAMAS